MAKIIAGRRVDIYTHQDERLTIALKYRGEPALYLFTNESYQFEHLRNPAWKLEAGTYRLRITVHYERGEIQKDFELCNTGPELEDVKIQPWTTSVTA